MYYLMISLQSGSVQGINGPNLDQWPEGSWARFSVDAPPSGDLQRFYVADDGSLAERDPLVLAKAARQDELLRVINNFIEAKPDGQVRYDTNLKLNLMQATMAAMATGQATPATVTEANDWIAAVKAKYFALKGEIKAAATLAELEAIDLSYAALEAFYGVAGTVLADPDIYTEDLTTE